MNKLAKGSLVAGTVGAISLLIVLSSCGSISLSGAPKSKNASSDQSEGTGEAADTEKAAENGASASNNSDDLTAAQRFELWMNTKDNSSQFNKLVQDYPSLKNGTYEDLYTAAAKETFSKAEVEGNEVIQKDRELISAIKAYDPSDSGTVSAIANLLGGKSLGVIDSNGHSYSHLIEAKAEHCYVAFGKWKKTLGSEAATDAWSTQDSLRYQLWDVDLLSEYEPGKDMRNENNLSREHLTGVCVTTDKKLSYDLNLEFPGTANSYQFVIIEIPKKSMPNYLRVQTVSHALDDVCSPYLWAEHWTHPVPGTLYYNNSVPVLVTGHFWPGIGRYRAFPTEYSVVTPYLAQSVISWKDAVSKTETLKIESAHLPIAPTCPKMSFDPELSRCENSHYRSYDCCKTNVTAIMEEKVKAEVEAARLSGNYEAASKKAQNDVTMAVSRFCGASEEINDIYYGNIVDAIIELNAAQDYDLSDYYLDF